MIQANNDGRAHHPDVAKSEEDCGIEITPEMIEAGYGELREHPLGADLRWLADKVYMAMSYAGPFGNLDASSNLTSK